MVFLNKNVSINILVAFLLSFVVRYYYSIGTQMSKTSLTITLIMIFSCVAVFLLCKDDDKLQNRNYLRIGPIFVVGYVIVHFFNYLAYLLSEIDFLAGYGFYRETIINEAAINSSCALVAFMIGYLVITKPFKCKRKKTYNVGLYLDCLALFFFFIFYVSVDKRYFNGGYGEVFNSGGISSITGISQNLCVASVIGSSCSKLYQFSKITLLDYIRSYSKLYYFVVFVFLFLIIMSGDRTPLIQIGMCYFSVFFLINKKRMTFVKIILPMSMAVVFLYFLGNLRAIQGDFSIKKMEETSTMISDELGKRSIVFAVTYELSGVARSYHVIYNYTERNGTFYGLAFFDQILGVIPGLRPLLVYPLLGIENSDKFNTNKISTRELQRDDAGMGTTCCADIYINFGFVGTIIVFLFFGFLFKKFDLELYNSKYNLFVIALAINYLTFAIYMGRGKFSTPLTISMYTFFLIYVASAMNTKSNKSLI